VGASPRDEPAQRAQLPDDVRVPDHRDGSLRDGLLGCLNLGGVCSEIAAAQTPSKAHSARGHRHQRRLRQGVNDSFGNARMVSDKFHVIQNVVAACDEVRKAESRADTGNLNTSSHYTLIK